MKRLLVMACLVLLILPTTVSALTWHTANQFTIEWDPADTLSDGSPIPDDSYVEYVIYLANDLTDPNKTNPAKIGNTTTLRHTFTLTDEAPYIPGVKAVRKLKANDKAVSESIIAWGDVPEHTNGNPFGVHYYRSPANPGGIRKPAQ